MGTTSVGSNRGFTYVVVLMMVLIIGIMLGAAGQVWTTVMKRDREAELLFRGGQIRDAIERWKKPRPGQPPPRPITDLKDLLLDPNSLQKIRYLRRLYQDPITGEDWLVIKDPATGIIGVASSSKETPLKQGGFAEPFTAFEGKTKYSEWEFVYRPTVQGAATAATTGAATTGGMPETTSVWRTR